MSSVSFRVSNFLHRDLCHIGTYIGNNITNNIFINRWKKIPIISLQVYECWSDGRGAFLRRFVKNIDK